MYCSGGNWVAEAVIWTKLKKKREKKNGERSKGDKKKTEEKEKSNKKKREKQVEIKGTHYKSFLDLQNFSPRKAQSYCNGWRQTLSCVQMGSTSREGRISLG